MSDPTERPGPGREPDPDAWERACAEDLAAERARHGRGGPQEPGSAAEELRRLVDAVAEKVAAIQLPLGGPTAQVAVRHFVDRARSVVEPVIERNPEVFDHLAGAGSELLAAYRAAVHRQEARWTRGEPPAPRSGGDEGPSSGENHRIDLD
ncbi:DUF5304 domain-containing protein [Streptomyces sp. NPDC049555]|uniref:DUF5304 domain-containing protein n=1 Tax=unclassified Streptomyces TaxID=2593676 RepID=UPI00342FD587